MHSPPIAHRGQRKRDYSILSIGDAGHFRGSGHQISTPIGFADGISGHDR
jgi:hypothetical protein